MTVMGLKWVAYYILSFKYFLSFFMSNCRLSIRKDLLDICVVLVWRLYIIFSQLVATSPIFRVGNRNELLGSSPADGPFYVSVQCICISIRNSFLLTHHKSVKMGVSAFAQCSTFSELMKVRPSYHQKNNKHAAQFFKNTIRPLNLK